MVGARIARGAQFGNRVKIPTEGWPNRLHVFHEGTNLLALTLNVQPLIDRIKNPLLNRDTFAIRRLADATEPWLIEQKLESFI